MDCYKRAYRDPNSPLAPLTPLSSQNVFNFDLGADPQGKPTIEKPKRYSAEFLKIRQVFEKQQSSKLARSPLVRSKLATTSKTYLDVPKRQRSTVRQQQQQCPATTNKLCYRQSTSPIAAQPLSPRTADVLHRVGMDKYKDLFQREEIDIQIFRMLSSKDLSYLGITCTEDQQQLLKAIEFAFEFY